MDNIKKFEDFLDRMQGLLDSAKKQGHILVRVEDLENTFPELQESEDERIRKGLIKALSSIGKRNWGGIDVFESISWLEKQGESTDINPSEFDLRLNKLLKQFETLPKEELASSLSFYLNVVQNDGTYKAEEKQGEQKSTDKVEPKFHKGEWITNGDYTWKIVEVKPLDYILQSQDGNIVDDTISYVDEQFHLFTLQDAKDGDVLVSKYNKPFIYNGNRDFCHVGSYCGLSTSDKFIVSTSKCFWTENMSIRPATKEQRDTLMKAMADAGYTFDFEKKELKKIELTKSESEEELSDFEAALFSAFSDGWQQYLHGEEVDFAQWAKEHSAELLEAANQNHVAWSEEDEAMWAEISDLLWEGYKQSSSKFSWDDIRNWLNPKLKSLRPQSTWKPTKDQMEALHDLNLTGNISYVGQGQVLIELYNDLKKL